MAQEPRGRTADRVRAAHGGRPIRELLLACRAEGLSQRQTAARLGCSQNACSKWSQALGIEWPRASRVVRYQGQTLSLDQLAKRAGLRVWTVVERWERGIRDPEALMAPPRWSTAPPPEYRVGWSVSDWQRLVAEVEAGEPAKRVARRYHVPLGALGAVLRGEWERVV